MMTTDYNSDIQRQMATIMVMGYNDGRWAGNNNGQHRPKRWTEAFESNLERSTRMLTSQKFGTKGDFGQSRRLPFLLNYVCDLVASGARKIIKKKQISFYHFGISQGTNCWARHQLQLASGQNIYGKNLLSNRKSELKSKKLSR